MIFNFPPCCLFTLGPQQDGQGFHVTAGDSGGMTSYGISEVGYEEYYGVPPTEAQMKAITPKTAAPIYHQNYWDAAQCELWPLGLDLMVFDHGVTSGPATSIKLMQEVLRIPADGVIGNQTRTAVRAIQDVHTFIGKLSFRQETYYRSLAKFPEFGNGWLARLDRRTLTAVLMLKPNGPGVRNLEPATVPVHA